jgi:hypothetical protein
MGVQLAAKDKPRSNDDQVMAALRGISHLYDLIVVENPLATIANENQKRESIRSLRDDPLAGMHSRKQIDDAMFHAGREWQKHHEHAALGSVSAIDPTKEAVDGGRFPDVLTDQQRRASIELAKARVLLGYQGRVIVEGILGQNRTVQEFSMSQGLCSEREFKYIGMRFRECLETLAKLWGFAK